MQTFYPSPAPNAGLIARGILGGHVAATKYNDRPLTAGEETQGSFMKAVVLRTFRGRNNCSQGSQADVARHYCARDAGNISAPR
jgi:hypothetical protein